MSRVSSRVSNELEARLFLRRANPTNDPPLLCAVATFLLKRSTASRIKSDYAYPCVALRKNINAKHGSVPCSPPELVPLSPLTQRRIDWTREKLIREPSRRWYCNCAGFSRSSDFFFGLWLPPWIKVNVHFRFCTLRKDRRKTRLFFFFNVYAVAAFLLQRSTDVANQVRFSHREFALCKNILKREVLLSSSSVLDFVSNRGWFALKYPRSKRRAGITTSFHSK